MYFVSCARLPVNVLKMIMALQHCISVQLLLAFSLELHCASERSWFLVCLPSQGVF